MQQDIQTPASQSQKSSSLLRFLFQNCGFDQNTTKKVLEQLQKDGVNEPSQLRSFSNKQLGDAGFTKDIAFKIFTALFDYEDEDYDKHSSSQINKEQTCQYQPQENSIVQQNEMSIHNDEEEEKSSLMNDDHNAAQIIELKEPETFQIDTSTKHNGYNNGNYTNNDTSQNGIEEEIKYNVQQTHQVQNQNDSINDEEIQQKQSRESQQVNNNQNQLNLHDQIFALQDKKSNQENIPTSNVIFESCIDQGSEYKMFKMRTNNEALQFLFTIMKTNKIRVVGFYGDFQLCVQAALNFIDSIEDKDYQQEQFDEGIVFLMNKQFNVKLDNQENINDSQPQKLALILKTDPQLFKFDNEVDNNNLFSTYIRILIDTCETIVCVPPSSLILNPDLRNPYEVHVNLGFQMQQVIVKPDEKMAFKPIQYGGSKNQIDYSDQNFCCYPDNSKFIAMPIFNSRQVEKYFQFSHFVNFIEGKKYNSYSKSLYNYNQIKENVLLSWPQDPSRFQSQNVQFKRELEQNLKILLSGFVNAQNKDQVNELIKKAQDRFTSESLQLNQNFNSDFNKLVMPFYKEFYDSIGSISCKHFQLVIKQIQENLRMNKEDKEQNQVQLSEKKGFVSSLFGLFTNQKVQANDQIINLECSLLCSSYQIQNLQYSYYIPRYDNIQWNILEQFYTDNKIQDRRINIHKHQDKAFVEFIKQLSQKIQNFQKERLQDKRILMTSLRQNILEEFFANVTDLIQTKTVTIINSVKISFQQFNIIRDSQHEISEWNQAKLLSSLQMEFGKESQGIISLKQIFFTSDSSGLILFGNTPEHKSSIYYFNIGNKMQVMFTHHLTLSSDESNLVVDSSLKQWFTYDNKQRRTNLGKLDKLGKIEDGSPLNIYDQQADGELVTDIIDAIIIPFGNKILLLNQNHSLFEYRYQQRNLTKIFKKYNKGGIGVIKEQIKPTGDEYYEKIFVISDGKNIILKAQTQIDIFDQNWNRVKKIEFERQNFLFCKTFTDKNCHFLIIFYQDTQQCYQIQSLTASKQFQYQINNDNQVEKSKGNPILDNVYQAIHKYGPHSTLNGCPSQTRLIFANHESKFDPHHLQQYFESLRVNDVRLEVVSYNINEYKVKKILLDFRYSIDKSDLKFILLSRIPLHLATIENSSLVPLRDGQNISDKIADSMISSSSQFDEAQFDLLERVTNLVRFGIYEDYLMSTTNDIKVVSIVGRQSSGKSYVMNRIFGTRFNVAATRCTDGIWMSFVELKDSLGIKRQFLVLDCEGLFSTRRNQIEEIKLCLTLSAISDMMILNQDLAFSRHLNQLFTNFSKSMGRIKGQKLFKGSLMMMIRDVPFKEQEQAFTELQSNVLQLQGNTDNQEENFLSHIFQGRLMAKTMVYFEQPEFNKDIKDFRDLYIFRMNDKRWVNGRDLTESLKIVLTQVFLDDDTDTDIHKMRLSCDKSYSQSIQLFFKFDRKIEVEGQIYEQEFTIDGKVHKLQIQQNQMQLQQTDGDTFEFDNDNPQLSVEFFKIFIDQTLEYSQRIHNDWMNCFSQYLEEFMNQRRMIIKQYFHQQVLQDQEEFKEIIENYEQKLMQQLDQFILKMLYCRKTCKECKRVCNLQLGHKNNCNCSTGHICEDLCEVNPECRERNYLCTSVYGHLGKHQCNDGNHKCSSLCQVENCKHLCQKEIDHSQEEPHQCGNKHQCQVICQDEICERTC
ncbi:UNKNOWN [Stylonychia lemnae]|uniref:VLIG-type G domain-containing protein n=1 Tax=Stylonychia lemnae TaxID=5949 RepID=A0A078ANU9_STYLE|nr:UNKNOWN [Stylonychia lemnae]|eukprot:CDW83834.1 UNKNOWN [Stylonychia lemnae]